MTASQYVALGHHKYRIDRSWIAAGRDYGLTRLASLAFGADELLYVLRRERPYVIAFSTDGEPVASLDAVNAPDGHGIFPAPDGTLWIAARDDHCVVHVAADGTELARIGDRTRPTPFGPLGHPTRAVVAPDGEIYITDGYADAVVLRYDPDGALIGSWGAPGVEPGAFRTPHSLWVTHERVYVADRDNDRMQVFDRAGQLLAVWTDFLRPMDVWGDGDGQLFVTEQVPRLSLWSPDGTLLGRCRIPASASHGISGDTDGRLYVVEINTDTITRLVPVDPG